MYVHAAKERKTERERDTVSGFAIISTVRFGKPSLPPTQLSHLLFALAASAAAAAAEEAAALPAPQAVA